MAQDAAGPRAERSQKQDRSRTEAGRKELSARNTFSAAHAEPVNDRVNKRTGSVFMDFVILRIVSTTKAGPPRELILVYSSSLFSSAGGLSVASSKACSRDARSSPGLRLSSCLASSLS